MPTSKQKSRERDLANKKAYMLDEAFVTELQRDNTRLRSKNAYERCPGFKYLEDLLEGRKLEYIELSKNNRDVMSWKDWKDQVEQLRTRRDREPVNVWQLILNAVDVRSLTPSQNDREGYTRGWVVVNSEVLCMTGTCIPINGDDAHAGYLLHYKDARSAMTACTAEGDEVQEGLLEVTPLSDVLVIIYENLSKAVRKIVVTEELAPKVLGHCLEGQMNLMDDLQRLRNKLIDLENDPEVYKSAFEVAEAQCNNFLKTWMAFSKGEPPPKPTFPHHLTQAAEHNKSKAASIEASSDDGAAQEAVGCLEEGSSPRPSASNDGGSSSGNSGGGSGSDGNKKGSSGSDGNKKGSSGSSKKEDASAD